MSSWDAPDLSASSGSIFKSKTLSCYIWICASSCILLSSWVADATLLHTCCWWCLACNRHPSLFTDFLVGTESHRIILVMDNWLRFLWTGDCCPHDRFSYSWRTTLLMTIKLFQSLSKSISLSHKLQFQVENYWMTSLTTSDNWILDNKNYKLNLNFYSITMAIKYYKMNLNFDSITTVICITIKTR